MFNKFIIYLQASWLKQVRKIEKIFKNENIKLFSNNNKIKFKLFLKYENISRPLRIGYWKLPLRSGSGNNKY